MIKRRETCVGDGNMLLIYVYESLCAYIVYRRKCENACKKREKKYEKAERRGRREEEKTRNVEATNETLTVSFYLWTWKGRGKKMKITNRKKRKKTKKKMKKNTRSTCTAKQRPGYDVLDLFSVCNISSDVLSYIVTIFSEIYRMHCCLCSENGSSSLILFSSSSSSSWHHAHTNTHSLLFICPILFSFFAVCLSVDCIAKTANLVFSPPFSSIIHTYPPRSARDVCVCVYICSGWCMSTDELNCDNSLISLLFISVICISLYTYLYNIPNIGFYRTTLSEWQHIRLHICSPNQRLVFLLLFCCSDRLPECSSCGKNGGGGFIHPTIRFTLASFLFS